MHILSKISVSVALVLGLASCAADRPAPSVVAQSTGIQFPTLPDLCPMDPAKDSRLFDLMTSALGENINVISAQADCEMLEEAKEVGSFPSDQNFRALLVAIIDESETSAASFKVIRGLPESYKYPNVGPVRAIAAQHTYHDPDPWTPVNGAYFRTDVDPNAELVIRPGRLASPRWKRERIAAYAATMVKGRQVTAVYFSLPRDDEELERIFKRPKEMLELLRKANGL